MSNEFACLTPPIGNNGTIFIADYDNTFYAVNSSGAVEWFCNFPNAMFGTAAIGDNGLIYFGGYYLYTFGPDGSIKWVADIGQTTESSPVIRNGVLYIGSYNGRLYAIRVLSQEMGSTPWPMFHCNTKRTGRVD